MTVKFRSKSTASIWTLAGLLVVAASGASMQARGLRPVPAQVATASPLVQGAPPATTPKAAESVEPPPTYVIGVEDVLNIVFWRDKDMSADVVVRPDGKISLPLLGDIKAIGLTPTELRDVLVEQSRRFIEDPNVTVVIRQINSRRVFITGEVNKPGPYPLGGPTTVLQLIATAGGLREYADSKKIVVMRTENGQPTTFPFNYKDVVSRKSLQQNIELKPGDTVIVP